MSSVPSGKPDINVNFAVIRFLTFVVIISWPSISIGSNSDTLTHRKTFNRALIFENQITISDATIRYQETVQERIGDTVYYKVNEPQILGNRIGDDVTFLKINGKCLIKVNLPGLTNASFTPDGKQKKYLPFYDIDAKPGDKWLSEHLFDCLGSTITFEGDSLDAQTKERLYVFTFTGNFIRHSDHVKRFYVTRDKGIVRVDFDELYLGQAGEKAVSISDDYVKKGKLKLYLEGKLAPPQIKPVSKDTLLKRRMDEAMRTSDLPAVVAIAVNIKGEQFTYTHGKAIWSEQDLVTPEHIFRIYSMTKIITSIAAMQLVEKKLVTLDEDLIRFLPDMSKIPILDQGKLVQAQNPITLRHLLSHTSGFGYPFTDEQLAKFDRSNWKYNDLPRRFESGTQFLYGTSIDWVGELVEEVSEMSLAEYIEQNITGPLGMKRTFFNVPDSLKQFIVSQGRRGDDGMQPLTEATRLPGADVKKFNGGGGLYSTPHDFSRLLQAMLNDGELGKVKILKASTVREMRKNQIGKISMADAGRYHAKGTCCNFEGITSPTTKWGLGGLIDNEDKRYGRKAGTILWGGLLNTYFYIDYASGIAVSIYTQHLPFNHPETKRLLDEFSKFVYETWK